MAAAKSIPTHCILKVARNRLFESAGIVAVSRAALASKAEDLDTESVINALSAAEKIIDGIAATLAGVAADLGGPPA